MTRKTVNLDTYMRIKEYFSKNPETLFFANQIRNALKIDYQSVLLVLGNLEEEGSIEKKGNVYRWRNKNG